MAPTAEPPVSDNSAVLALVAQADTDAGAGRLVSAAATVERALRIEPRNPRLWLKLARLRLAQGQPEQAEHLAERALSWSGDDAALRAANWRLIAEARTARGDLDGARAAEARAGQYQR
jgi:predicted Zn-dependent protease